MPTKTHKDGVQSKCADIPPSYMTSIVSLLMIHNFVVGKMEEKEKGRGWGGGWVQGAGFNFNLKMALNFAMLAL